MTVPVARSALLLHISAIIYLKCILLDPIKRRFFSRNCILFGRMPQVLARTKDFWFRDGNHAFVCPELLQRPENVKYVWILCKNAESSSVLTGAMTWNYSNETYREYEICGSLAKTVFPYVEETLNINKKLPGLKLCLGQDTPDMRRRGVGWR